MKKIAGMLALAIVLNISYLNFTNAQEEYECKIIDGQKVCFAKEIMGELMKEAIYHVGSKALEKVKDNKFENSNSNSNNTNTSNYSNYVDNSSNSSSETQEEMIPI